MLSNKLLNNESSRGLNYTMRLVTGNKEFECAAIIKMGKFWLATEVTSPHIAIALLKNVTGLVTISLYHHNYN